MRSRILLLTLLLTGTAWADGMVGVPDARSERAAAGQPAGKRIQIIVDGGGGPQRTLADYEAYLARERSEAEARRRQQELERTAALDYIRGTTHQAAREARATAEREGLRRRHEQELDAAGNFAFACPLWDPRTGCRGSSTGK